MFFTEDAQLFERAETQVEEAKEHARIAELKNEEAVIEAREWAASVEDAGKERVTAERLMLEAEREIRNADELLQEAEEIKTVESKRGVVSGQEGRRVSAVKLPAAADSIGGLTVASRSVKELAGVGRQAGMQAICQRMPFPADGLNFTS